MTLYDRLGVGSDASPAEIKLAYRRAAMSAHPDAGGSDKEFTALHKAYLVLMDDERRRRYDATGDETEAAPDNGYAEVLATISMHLDRVVISALQYDQAVTQTDVIDVLRRSLREAYVDLEKQKDAAQKSVAVWKTLIGRFHVKQGGAPSVLASLVDAKIRAQTQVIEEGERRKKVLDAAADLLKNEEFDVEKVPPLRDGLVFGFPRPRFGGIIHERPADQSMFGKGG